MDHLLSKEKGRRQKSLQAKNRRRRNLGKKEEKEILQTVMFSFEGPALKLKYGPIAQLVRAHA